jgi:hypothetical protein
MLTIKLIFALLVLALTANVALAQSPSTVQQNAFSYTTTGTTFANLNLQCGSGTQAPTPPGCANQTLGTIVYCKDCAAGVNGACAGGGTGLYAKRVGPGTWKCADVSVTSGTDITNYHGAVGITGNGTNGSDQISSLNVNGVANIAAFGAKCDGTTDNTSSIQAAINSFGGKGGRVFVPSCAGAFNWNSQLTFPRNVMLECAQADGPLANAESTQLRYMGTGTSAAIVFADTGSQNLYPRGGIRNCGLMGPTLGPAPVGSTTALWLGGDPAGVYAPNGAYGDMLSFQNVKITRFGYGLKMGQNAFTMKFDHVIWTENGTNIYDHAEGENTSENQECDHCTVQNATAHIFDINNLESEWHFISSSLDYNAGPGIIGVPASGTSEGNWGAAVLSFTDCHFEQGAGAFIDSSSAGFATILINGGWAVLTNTSGTTDTMFQIGGTSPVFQIYNTAVLVGSGQTLNSVLKFVGSGSNTILTVSNVVRYNGTITSWANLGSFSPSNWGVNIWEPIGTQSEVGISLGFYGTLASNLGYRDGTQASNVPISDGHGNLKNHCEGYIALAAGVGSFNASGCYGGSGIGCSCTDATAAQPVKCAPPSGGTVAVAGTGSDTIFVNCM